MRPLVLIVQLELGHRSPARVLDRHFQELSVLVLDGEVERHSEAVAGLAAAGLREDVATGRHDARHRLLVKRDLVHDARRVNKVHEFRERRGDHRGEDVHGEAGGEHEEERRERKRALRMFLRAADALPGRGFGQIAHAACPNNQTSAPGCPNPLRVLPKKQRQVWHYGNVVFPVTTEVQPLSTRVCSCPCI